MIQIVPSILSADFAYLGKEMAQVKAAGAQRIQVDVMDGIFVPNITVGPPVVQALRKATDLSLEVHLMIQHPERFLEVFAQAGADGVIVHQEACTHLHRAVQEIKALGKRAGVAINPATPAVVLEEIIQYLDLVLVMTVNPGFGGQEFIPGMLPKIRKVRQLIQEKGLTCELEVDGGIHVDTAPLVVDAGADVLVAGAAIFDQPDGVAAAMQRLRHSVSG